MELLCTAFQTGPFGEAVCGIDRATGAKKPDELPLSVPGQVERLLKEATADTNLCRMYFGWTPFL